MNQYLNSKLEDEECISKSSEYDVELYKYWKSILGEEVIKEIKNSYGISIKDIIAKSKYNVNKSDTSCDELKKLYYNEPKDEIFFNFNIGDNQLAFDGFFMQFIRLGIYILREKSKNNNCQIFEKTFAENLLNQLGKISLSTLMFEMYICKKENLLKGNDEKEEYIDYNERFLKDKEYVKKLFEIYPCLERLVLESIHNLSINYINIIERLEADHKLIVENICGGADFNRVINIHADISDSHKRGKTVFILDLDNGIKIVYKPRSLKIEDSYQRFLEYVSKGCKYDMGYFKVVDCGEYGWEEFVEYKTCHKRDEIERYYYRFGVLIFCNYILNTNDLHEENLIAAGEYPIIIDAETILDNKRRKEFNTSTEAINDILHESVLYSGLLPHYRFSNVGKGIDMSAINGKEGEKYPIKIPHIVDLCTSNMHFTYENPVTHHNKNLVMLNEEVISSFSFIDYIDDGFRDAYMYILENKEQTLEFVRIFENLNVRHLVQDTQRYSMLIHTSIHPDFMQNEIDRQLVLCSILDKVQDVQGSKEVGKIEIEDMLHMDIPYFYLNTSYKSLYGFGGKEVKDYFSTTSMEHLIEKIYSLDFNDMERQSMFTKIILTDIENFHVDEKELKFKQIGERKSIYSPLKAAEKLAESLLESAVFNNKKDDVNWIGVTLIGDEENCDWDIRPLGTYLYEGLSGIAIFFNALQKLNPQNIYKNICSGLMKALFNYTDDMCERTGGLENESSGAFAGEASLVYTYQVLYKITNNEEYFKYAEKHSAIIEKAILSDENFDIVYGNAGSVIILLNMYEMTKNKKYLEIAKDAGLFLVYRQEKHGESKGGWTGEERKCALAGFSHGAAGIILALVKLWNATKDITFLNSAIDGLEFENTLFEKNQGNWKDERFYSGEKTSDKGIYPIAWCHGAAGILLSRVKIYNILPENIREKVSEDIEIAKETIMSQGIMGNNCLCHGNLGNTEILIEYLLLFHDKKIEKFSKELRRNVSQNICNGKFDCDNAYLYGYKLQGFMTGLTGVGYSLLRDIDDELPCILSLDIK